MATWGDLKANAATFLGIKLTDADVGAVPLLATDPYGNFIRGANGLPQLVVNFTNPTTHVVTQGLLEGNLAAPVATHGTFNGLNYAAIAVGSTFLDDIAHNAVPVVNASGQLVA